MLVGWIQTRPTYGDPAANLRAVERIVVSVSADLWVLPELFATGYVFGSRSETERLAEPIPDGPTTQAIMELAKRSSAALIAGVAERAPDGKIFNSAIAVDATGLRGQYRKIHLFDYEKEWFDPGDGPLSVVDLAGARVGMMICFDWRFPETARTLALRGAQLLAHPSNLVQPYCQAAMVTRALENRVFTITTNRIGTEQKGGIRFAFTGQSRIVDPDGAILSDGPAECTAFDVVTIDPSLADTKRVTGHNDVIGDRRPSFYGLD
jgi:predicted amidohydrolase